MKKVMLLMLGLSLFAVSCQKKEVENDANSMNDSTDAVSTYPDNTETATSMDTTASVRDSIMNQSASGQSNRADGNTHTDSMR